MPNQANGKNNNNNNNNRNSLFKSPLVILAVVMVLFIIFGGRLTSIFFDTEQEEVSYSVFLDAVDNNQIEKAEISDTEISYTLKEEDKSAKLSLIHI